MMDWTCSLNERANAYVIIMEKIAWKEMEGCHKDGF
jgi:hypothetical protein